MEIESDELILYRGKRKDDGSWIEGAPIGTTTYIREGIVKEEIFCNEKWIEVVNETLTRWTGKKDSCGTKIFCGDVLESILDSKRAFVEANEEDKETVFDFVICADVKDVVKDDFSLKNWKVIGNIFDDYRIVDKKEIKRGP